MLRDYRRLDAPELDAFHHAIEVRSPSLRVGVHRSKNVASDYALVERGSPFVHRGRRVSLTILLSGHGRFDERGRRAWLEEGALVVSDERRLGVEAYAGPTCSLIAMSWDPAVMGAPMSGRFARLRLTRRDLERVRAAALELDGPRPALGAIEIVDVLRSAGIPLERVRAADLEQTVGEPDRKLQAAFAAQLSKLDERPALEDLASKLGWNHRQIHRRFSAFAESYGMPWAHWRSALHQVRMLQAFRLLSAPGATTDAVARLTGFRAPSALCHAFAKADLPSPGALARAARQDVLDAWSAYGAPLPGAAAGPPSAPPPTTR